MADRMPASRMTDLFVAATLALAVASCSTPGASPSPVGASPSPAGTSPSPVGASPSAVAESPTPSATGPLPTVGSTPTSSIVLMTHDSFAISEDVLAEFEARSGVRVEILRAGDAGVMVNQAILTVDAPLADVMYGVDNAFLSRALDAGIFEAHRPPLLSTVSPELVLDPDGRVTPIDYGDVCINYDRTAFAAAGAPPAPVGLEELTAPAYRSMLVVENPATSSPGLAFLLATVGHFGEAGDYTWRDYWADLRANDVLVTSGWEEAYNGAFSGGAGQGDRPIVVSYATSPAAEVLFADPPREEPPTASLTEGCFRQIEFAGVLAGTAHRTEAQALIDFMLEPTFQADMPLNMFVFPANSQVGLPEVFVEHAATVPEPITIDQETLGAQRERWIEEWTDVVLR
jgi:thiamine transport system substrate-binding protein